MPFSTHIFKDETVKFIKRKTENNTNINILDVGAGAGTYADLLSTYPNIDAIEIFESYVNEYKLRDRYRNVFVEDVRYTQIDFSTYDLIILGDVFEHLTESDAYQLLSKIFTSRAEIILAVPFNSSQGEEFGNIHERHLQPNLTLSSILKKYKELIPLCVRYDYGVFIRNNVSNEYTPIFYKDLDESYVQKLKQAFPYKSLINVDEQTKEIDINEIFLEEVRVDVTIVTGLWDLGRGEISDSFKRSYDEYKEKFSQLMESPVNMIIYASKKDEEFIWKHRSRSNTVIKHIELEEFKTWFDKYELVQTIRKDATWFSQTGWLVESPQAVLEYYNPIVMSKMFMLNNATIYNPFDTQYFFWIDAGITSTVHPGYFTHDKVFSNLPTYIHALQKFIFLSYPYEGGQEIHGFDRKEIAKYCNVDYVNYVCRGGFFGGEKTAINLMNGIYYGLLSDTLNNKLMGTEESIFTIMAHRYPELIHTFELESNGLIWPFFEKLKDVTQMILDLPKQELTYRTAKNNLYILTFNSPLQFKSICESIKNSDTLMFERSKKILINNSTNQELFAEYDNLCVEYNFEEIHKENIGVCGGRQFAAEHFAESTADFYMFFEDDMMLNNIEYSNKFCKSGFIQYVPNLYSTILKIMIREKFDFLKLSFSEFYGSNDVQWAWYNVPQDVRTMMWPEYDKLPEIGLDENAPKTKFDNIKIMDGISYITGEVYYSNWPQIVSRDGNQKMFLDTKWEYPYEQTWMSHMYQLTKKNELKPAILLASPITHNRFDHYDAGLRKES